MEKLLKLMSLCKNSVTVTVNQHRDYYESVDSYLREYGDGNVPAETDPEVYDRMVKDDIVVHVQAYPHSAGAFYDAFHYDLISAIDEVINCIESKS